MQRLFPLCPTQRPLPSSSTGSKYKAEPATSTMMQKDIQQSKALSKGTSMSVEAQMRARVCLCLCVNTASSMQLKISTMKGSAA